MNIDEQRLWAWLEKYGDDLSKQAIVEFGKAMQSVAGAESRAPEFGPSPLEKILPLVPSPAPTHKKLRLVPKTPSAPCHRGDQTVDKNGQPFVHHYDKTLDYCIFCGDGVEQDNTPDANANLLANGGTERVWCNEHGIFHDLKVKPDGTLYDTPDCEIFKNKEVHEP